MATQSSGLNTGKGGDGMEGARCGSSGEIQERAQSSKRGSRRRPDSGDGQSGGGRASSGSRNSGPKNTLTAAAADAAGVWPAAGTGAGAT